MQDYTIAVFGLKRERRNNYVFSNTKSIADSPELTRHWMSYVHSFSSFEQTDVFRETIYFTHPLDYFELSSNTAEKLRMIGEPYDLFDKTTPITLNEFTVNIFEGVNDKNGISSPSGIILTAIFNFCSML